MLYPLRFEPVSRAIQAEPVSDEFGRARPAIRSARAGRLPAGIMATPVAAGPYRVSTYRNW